MCYSVEAEANIYIYNIQHIHINICVCVCALSGISFRKTSDNSIDRNDTHAEYTMLNTKPHQNITPSMKWDI